MLECPFLTRLARRPGSRSVRTASSCPGWRFHSARRSCGRTFGGNESCSLGFHRKYLHFQPTGTWVKLKLMMKNQWTSSHLCDGGEGHVALVAIVLADPLVVILDVGSELVGSRKEWLLCIITCDWNVLSLGDITAIGILTYLWVV